MANLLAFQPRTSGSLEVLAIPDYTVAPYLVIATRTGMVKKSLLTDCSTPPWSGGIIAINLRDDDEVIAPALVSPEDDLPLAQPQGPEHPVPRHRRDAAPDGPGTPRA